MEYTYEVRALKPGDTLTVRDGELFVGSSLQANPDAPGKFLVTAHLLVPAELRPEKGN